MNSVAFSKNTFSFQVNAQTNCPFINRLIEDVIYVAKEAFRLFAIIYTDAVKQAIKVGLALFRETRDLSKACFNAVKGFVKWINPVGTPFVWNRLLGGVFKLTEIAERIMSTPPFNLVIKSIPFFGLFPLPKTIMKIAQKTKGILHGNDEKKINSWVGLGKHVGDFYDYAVVLVEGLKTAGVMAISMAGSIALNAISAAFSVFSIVLHSLGISRSVRAMRELEKMVDFKNASKEDFEKVHDFLKNQEKGYIRRRFKIKGAVLLSALAEIRDKATDPKVYQKALAKLKQRVSNKIAAHSLAIVAGIINIIGMCMLFTPAAPIGFALIGLSCAINIGNVIYRNVVRIKFRKSLETLAAATA